nr:hypothetical protein [Ligilactobacillus ruminis]
MRMRDFAADFSRHVVKSFGKYGSLSNGVDDLENFTSEKEWSFLFPSVSPMFLNWYSYLSTPPAFPLAWIHV